MENVAEVVGQNFGAIVAVLGALGGSLIGVLASRIGSKTDARRSHVLESSRKQSESLAEIVAASSELYASLHAVISGSRDALQREDAREIRIPETLHGRVHIATERWRAALAQRHWLRSQEVAEASHSVDLARSMVVMAMNEWTVDDAAREIKNFEAELHRLTVVMNLANIDNDLEVSEALDTAAQRRRKRERLEADRSRVLAKIAELDVLYKRRATDLD